MLLRGGSDSLTATTNGVQITPVPSLQGGSDLWLEDIITTFLVSGGTALGASHKWVGTLNKRVLGNTDTAMETITIASGNSDEWRTDTQTIDALMNNGTTHYVFTYDWTKTGTPGNIFPYGELTYRIVET